MSVKLHEVMSAAQQRSASLAAEVAGYLVLAAADQVAGSPRATGWDDVALMEDGSVRVVSGAPSDEERAQRALRGLLGQMLLEASSVTPALFRAGQRAGQGGVDSLIHELEAALVPVNRAAARRALSRLHRDVMRAKESGTLGEYAPSPPPAREAEPTPRPSRPELEESVDLSGVLAAAAAEPAARAEPEPAPVASPPAVTNVVWPEAAPAVAAEPVADEVDELETVIPIYVELAEESVPTAPVAVRAPAELPEVPDLDVPPSPSAPVVEAPITADPATVPQPVVTRAKLAASRPAYEAFARTPPLGSVITELEAPPWPMPMETSAPAPSVLELAGEEATDRVPCTEELLDELSDAMLASLDPPPVAARRQPEPTPIMPEIERAPARPAPEPAAEALVVTALTPAPEARVLVESESESESESEHEHEHEHERDPAFHFVVEDRDVEYRSAAELLDDLDIFWQSPEAPAVDDWEQVVEAELLELSRAFEEVETDDDGELLAESLPEEPSPHPELALLFGDEAEASPAEALQPIDIYALPARPLPGASANQAPPRYAPRKSDISALVNAFSVAAEATERELCLDLKSLAGLDATALPPAVELDETPVPVAVAERDASASDPSREAGFGGRALAVTAALVLVGAGVLATRTSSAPALAATPIAAPAPVRTGEPAKEPACAAELTVRKLPAGSRPRLRGGPDGALLSPSRLSGDEAVFETLPCREAVELTVQVPGRSRWIRVPVRGEDLTPSAAEPGLVRHAVTL